MKYIDAEKLINLVREWRNKQMGFAWDAVNEVLKIIASLQQEQPEVDLEKEMLRYQREDMDRDTTVRDVARHFAEWQYQKDRRKFAELKAREWHDGFNACREQMMKEAVEGRYMKTISGECYVVSSVFSPDGFVQAGGKVELIILKPDGSQV